MKAPKFTLLHSLSFTILALFICLTLQAFTLAPSSVRQGDVKKFSYKEYTFIVRESGGKNHISIKKGIAEKKLKKPMLSYRNDYGIKVTEKIKNKTKLFIINGSDEDIIWLTGEGNGSVTPSFSGFYNFNGNVISYAFTLKTSETEAKLLNRNGDHKTTLEAYCITNFNEQINHQNTFNEQIGVW